VRAVGIALALALIIGAVTASSTARAADEVEAFARVVVDAAELRTGPGGSYRVIYTAHRGETLAIDGRPGSGFWLRVILPDGRVAFALGDEVQPFAVQTPGRLRMRWRSSSMFSTWARNWASVMHWRVGMVLLISFSRLQYMVLPSFWTTL